MRAIVSRTAGPPSTLRLERVDEPVPGPGELLVAVHACGVNYPDALIIEDRYQFRPQRPFSPGSEIAGEVIAVGTGVTGRQVGERILGFTTSGGMAERIVVRADRIYAVPAGMPLDEAAAFIMTYGTAYHALHDRAKLRAGETVLILGAAGGVGLAAVELAKAAGGRVVAAVSSEQKAAVATAHGADATVVYPRAPFDKAASKELAAIFKRACGAAGADVIVDPVGGDYTDPAMRVIAWCGRYLVLGFTAGVPNLAMNLPLLKGCDVLGIFWGAFSERSPELDRENIAKLFGLYAQGKIRPEIARRYPLEAAPQAIQALSERAIAGKMVVMVQE